jgi:Tfp pilus assembly protein PilX
MVVQHYENKKTGGYIALMSVLIVGAIGALLVFSMLQWGITDTSITIATSDAQQAYATAHGCLEELLEQVRDSSLTAGSATLTIGAGTCLYTISSPTLSTRKILATGIVGNATERVEVVVSALSPKITLTSWKELAAFQ